MMRRTVNGGRHGLDGMLCTLGKSLSGPRVHWRRRRSAGDIQFGVGSIDHTDMSYRTGTVQQQQQRRRTLVGDGRRAGWEERWGVQLAVHMHTFSEDLCSSVQQAAGQSSFCSERNDVSNFTKSGCGCGLFVYVFLRRDENISDGRLMDPPPVAPRAHGKRRRRARFGVINCGPAGGERVPGDGSASYAWCAA